ncbi:hypothetical protein D3C85_1747280 [compost metagenome]
MLADDFGFVIALDAPCARVPAGHIAILVEHVERIVGDALDQHAELLLADPQGFALHLPLHQVVVDRIG